MIDPQGVHRLRSPDEDPHQDAGHGVDPPHQVCQLLDHQWGGSAQREGPTLEQYSSVVLAGHAQ